MNSFNHYSFGAVAAWMYNYSLGIQRDNDIPGFKHFILEPTPDPTKEMKFAKGYYDSMYGHIESSWKWEDKGWDYSATIPANTTATLHLKTTSIKNIKVNGKKLKKSKAFNIVQKSGEEVILELYSGHHEFRVYE